MQVGTLEDGEYYEAQGYWGDQFVNHDREHSEV